VWQGTAIDAAYLDSTVVTTGDTGTVTSTMITDGTIVDGDVNASAEIAGTKIVQGSTSVRGTVQLEDSTSSTSTTTAATPNAVKSAYDLADAALPKAGGVLTGDVTLNAQSDLRFADADSSNWVALQAPATVASNVTWTLPATDGSAGQLLKTNGAGVLDWISPSLTGPILESQQTIGADYTLTSAYNGLSAGPVEVAAGISVTVPVGAVWAIV
ncbi:MAG TPA: tail fiber protein, partial [Marinobacter sp.]|nr:tail fiber protein [Marinobacter sp.]